MTDSDSVLAPLDGKSPQLFLMAGMLLLVFAALTGVNKLSEMAVHDLENTFGPGGFAIAFLGLLGLYPTLADRTPWLARTGAVFAAIGAVGATINAIGRFASFTGIITDSPAWVGIFGISIAIGMLLGFLLFGVATLRAGVHSWSLGLLLLSPLAIFGVMLSGLADGVFGEAVAPVVLASGQAATHLAIGVHLRSAVVSTDHPQPAVEATVE